SPLAAAPGTDQRREQRRDRPVLSRSLAGGGTPPSPFLARIVRGIRVARAGPARARDGDAPFPGPLPPGDRGGPIDNPAVEVRRRPTLAPSARRRLDHSSEAAAGQPPRDETQPDVIR